MIRRHDNKILKKDIMVQLWKKDGRHLIKQLHLICGSAGCRDSDVGRKDRDGLQSCKSASCDR